MDKIQLPDVTLIAVSSIKIPETILALQKSYKGIDFGAVKLISHECPKELPEEIQFEECPLLDDIIKYNRYIFKELYTHIYTSHCLLTQYDSWVLNPELWNNDWLQYDYCGAPWRWMPNSYICRDTGEHIRVGNGGMSLRSKKLIGLPKKYNIPLIHENFYFNEDGNIAVYNRVRFLELGIKYAPIEVAARFSYENPVLENNMGNMPTFGFHKNMPKGI